MTRKYVVTIDGTKYEVEVEESAVVKSTKTAVPEEAPAVHTTAAAVKPAASEATPAPASTAVAEGTKVTAPLPGTLSKILVNAGAAVNVGDKLCIIEAMKMENPIVAPCQGTVASVVAHEGDMLNVGDLMFVIA